MAKPPASRMLIPDDDDQDSLEIDREARKRWIKEGDKPTITPAPALPLLPPEPEIVKKKVLFVVDSDLLEKFDAGAKKKRTTRSAWLIQAMLDKLEKEGM